MTAVSRVLLEKVNETVDPNVPQDDAKLWKEDQIARHDKYPALVY